MEKYLVLLGVCLVASLVLAKLVWSVVKMWRKVRKEQADMKRLKAGSVWRQRPKTFFNDPFVEDDRFRVTVQETRVNSEGRMWVRYLYKSGLEDTTPADVFVQMFIYVEGQDYPIWGTREGEMVLNAAQRQNLAGQLQPRDMGGDRQPYAKGEMIILGIDNYLKRSGRGGGNR